MGTVRSDYGSGDNTWSYFPHEQARSRAYRWGEDGLAVVDVAFAKRQLGLLLNRRYLHPNGQLPAYEWNFSDVNPPVHAWATLFVYQIEEAATGKADRSFLEDAFQKLMRNFSWWLNRKDAGNRNIFQGGFLGLDNIGVFDRSAPLPGGGWIDQADGTAWMALYCQNMMQIAGIGASHQTGRTGTVALLPLTNGSNRPPRGTGRCFSGASRPALWPGILMAVRPACSRSSAATAVTIPTWITARSRPGFSGSVGRIRLPWAGSICGAFRQLRDWKYSIASRP